METPMKARWLLGVVMLAPWPVLAQTPSIDVRVVSGRPDMVSGGDALVQIAGADKASVTVNGRDVTKAFRPGPGKGSLLGRVEGLTAGRNSLEVKAGGRSARLDLLNHPIAGP